MKILTVLIALSFSLAAQAGSCGSLYTTPPTGTAFTAQIRTDSSGAKSLWIQPPATQADAPLPSPINLGSVRTLKKGTKLFHWTTPEAAQHLVQNGITEPEIVAAILNGTAQDLEGGGFYLAGDILSSAQFGSSGVVVKLQSDVQIVNADPFQFDVAKDYNLAARNAGIAGIFENAHQQVESWFNFIRVEGLAKKATLMSLQSLATDLKTDSVPEHAFAALVMLDQKGLADIKQWPADLFPSLKSAVTGGALSDADATTLTKAWVRFGGSLLASAMATQGGFRSTALIRLMDQAVTKQYGQGFLANSPAAPSSGVP